MHGMSKHTIENPTQVIPSENKKRYTGSVERWKSNSDDQ